MKTLFLSDQICAEHLEISECVKSIEKMYEIMRVGDYAMGGANGNSHGMRISFARSDNKQNVFIAMPGFLGGEYATAGLKWHGPNLRGATAGSTNYTLILSGPNDGSPRAILAANELTIFRTAALSLYAAKVLKRTESVREIGLIGAGRIHSVFLKGVFEMFPNAKRVKIKSKSENGINELKAKFAGCGVEILSVDSVEQALENSDLISVNPGFDFESLGDMPLIRGKYLKAGSLTLCLSFAKFSDAFLKDGALKIADNYAMYESYLSEFGYPVYPKFSSLGSRFADLVYGGEIARSEIFDLLDLAALKKQLNGEKPMVLSSGGMITEDIAVACDLIRKINSNLKEKK